MTPTALSQQPAHSVLADSAKTLQRQFNLGEPSTKPRLVLGSVRNDTVQR